MTFQTTQNNENNRDKNSPEELFEEICSIWQEFVDNYRTFTAELECDVKRVRELLKT
jgi:t-SNARE complex subunit (syntaxin)